MRLAAVLAILLAASPARATEFTSDQISAFNIMSGASASATLGVFGVAGLVTMIGNAATLHRPELRRPWQRANLAFSVLNLMAAFGWGVSGMVSWLWGEPVIITSEMLHYAIGVSGLGIGIASRAHEKDERKRMTITPLAFGVRLTW
jgi:hypothetical protein